MDAITLKLMKVFVTGILVNNLMLSGLSATKNSELAFTPQSPVLECNETVLECNETVLQQEIKKCGERFKTNMVEVEPQDRCNLTHFIGQIQNVEAILKDTSLTAAQEKLIDELQIDIMNRLISAAKEGLF